MPGLEWPWALLLLPLPLLARGLLAAAELDETAIAVPLIVREFDATATRLARAARWRGACLWVFWIALIIAASRPVWLGDAVSRSVSGRDLMLAVDISGSMSETDMTIDGRATSRLDVLKIVVQKFIERRDGDRLGLILFGSNAYNYVPLTFDLDTLGELLGDVSSGLAGRHTAIGDAIGIGLKAMHEQSTRHKVMILVTDGSNTAGFEDPVLAAAAAARQGLTIYTIGVGSDLEALQKIYGAQSVPTGIALNEPVLKRIAALTGGQYFRATNTRRLEDIYRALDRLEPVEHLYQSHRPRQELYPWPLLLGLLALLPPLLFTIIQSGRRISP